MIRNYSVYIHLNLVKLGIRADQLIARIGTAWKDALPELSGELGYALSDDGKEIIIQVLRARARDFGFTSDVLIGVYTTAAQIEAATARANWDVERGRVEWVPG